MADRQIEKPKEEFIYEMSLLSSYRATARATIQFEWLWELGDERPNLEVVRDKNLSWSIPDWRREHQETVARRAEERADRRGQIRQGFEEHRAEIRSGASPTWLEWLANIYFCRFQGIDADKTPRERLVQELKEVNADIALESFRALLRRNEFPRLDAQIKPCLSG